jgi:hypothetical protein
MDYIQVLRDSIDTSVSLKLFETKEESTMRHIFHSKQITFPLSKCRNLDNFNPDRLQLSANKSYPLYDRPRGDKDISSVEYHQRRIKHNIDIQPIWLFKQHNKYILLDGSHRIVASHIENKKYISAYIIHDIHNM